MIFIECEEPSDEALELRVYRVAEVLGKIVVNENVLHFPQALTPSCFGRCP
jgi:hypothetical protein